MAVHELATNAAKYGALSNGSGRISVHWTIAERDEEQLQIVWTETGGPKVAAPSSEGFGSRLIERGTGGSTRRRSGDSLSRDRRHLQDLRAFGHYHGKRAGHSS
jgi:two-component sensor histidine kinase